LPEPRIRLRADEWMDDCFEIAARTGIGEDDLREPAAIERAARVQYAGTETSDDRRQTLAAGFNRLARQNVRVDGRNAELVKLRANVALPCRNAAR